MAITGVVNISQAFGWISGSGAAIVALLAYRQSGRQSAVDRHRDDGEVGVARDQGNWVRMLDSIKRADDERTATAAELAEVRTELAGVRHENEALRSDMGEVQAHAERCEKEVTRLRQLIEGAKP